MKPSEITPVEEVSEIDYSISFADDVKEDEDDPYYIGRVNKAWQKKIDAAGGSVEVLKFTGAKGREKAAAGKGSQPSTGGS